MFIFCHIYLCDSGEGDRDIPFSCNMISAIDFDCTVHISSSDEICRKGGVYNQLDEILSDVNVTHQCKEGAVMAKMFISH